MIMEIRITSHKLGLSSGFLQFIEEKMRAIRRFVGDAVSAPVFLRRNAGTVPGKRFSARAHLTLSQGGNSLLLRKRSAERCCPQNWPASRVSGKGAV